MELVEASTYKWYGYHVGDYPMPEGFTEDDLGKCQYKLYIPGNPDAYEIGVVKNKSGSGYTLLYDFWGEQGEALVKRIGGQNGGKLKQSYGVHAATFAAKRQGFRVQKFNTADGGVQLALVK